MSHPRLFYFYVKDANDSGIIYLEQQSSSKSGTNLIFSGKFLTAERV